MERLLKEYRAMLEGQGWRKGIRWACKVAPVVAPLASLIGDVFSIATGVATGATALYVKDCVQEPKVPDRLMPAAMVHDTRRFFGQRMI